MFGRKLVVSQHRPVGKPLLVLTYLALLVFVAFAAYVYGTAMLSIRYKSVRDEREQLAERLLRWQDVNRELREKLALLERAEKIDRKAYEDVDKHLLGLQMEIFALKEEVAFYRSIVSTDRQTGFHIQSFDVIGDGVSAEGYRYQLVLTNNMKNDKVVSGVVIVSVVGELEGKARELSAGDLWPDNDHGVMFKFRHFQRVEGRLVLPEGFAPHTVTVHVIGSENKDVVAERTFSWPQPLS